VSWLDKAIARGVERGVRDTLNSPAFNAMLAERFWEIASQNPRFMFIKRMQARFQQVDPTMPDKRAFEYARGVLNTFLSDEKIEFGDPAYDWSRDGAITLANEDIEYWERTP